MLAGHVFSRTRFDVIVVGGGIAGITFANILASRCPDMSIALVDAAPPPTLDLVSFDSRVVALSHASQAVFERLGVWQHILNTRVCAYKEMYVWDGEGTANIHFDCRDIHRPTLGHIVENSVLMDCLHKRASELDNLERVYGVKVDRFKSDASKHSLTLDNAQVIHAALIVAADGANSRLRECGNIGLRQWDYGHSAIVTTVKTAKPHKFTARQRFSENGPLAFLPLTQNGSEANHCSIVWSVKHALANHYMSLDDATFCAELGRTFEFTLGDIEHSNQRLCFPLTQRNAKSYGHAGLALVGDAAHTIHPLAGQGANLGIADVKVLAEEVIRAAARAIPLHDPSIIKRFERRRMTHNLIAMSSMEGFKQLFGADDLGLRWLRNTALGKINALPFIKNELAKLACG